MLRRIAYVMEFHSGIAVLFKPNCPYLSKLQQVLHLVRNVDPYQCT